MIKIYELTKAYFNSILIHLSFGMPSSFKVYMNVGQTEYLMQTMRKCLISGNYRSVAMQAGGNKLLTAQQKPSLWITTKV